MTAWATGYRDDTQVRPSPRQGTRCCCPLRADRSAASMVDLISGAGAGSSPTLPTTGVMADRDVQLAWWMAYELFYRGFDDVDDAREWDPEVLRLRAAIEQRAEAELRRATRDRLDRVSADEPVGDALLRLVEDDEGPHLSAYLRRDATVEQMHDFLRERSVQQLKESDPQSFLLPRLDGPAKVALAEIQYDEYGAGRPEQPAPGAVRRGAGRCRARRDVRRLRRPRCRPSRWRART